VCYQRLRVWLGARAKQNALHISPKVNPWGVRLKDTPFGR
jgi:hypothetical protein